ncbi:hypothetical protein M8C21_032773, partial [Ambrosia artemisiifolia]
MKENILISRIKSTHATIPLQEKFLAPRLNRVKQVPYGKYNSRVKVTLLLKGVNKAVEDVNIHMTWGSTR